MSRRASMEMSRMTPRQLLITFTAMARMATAVNLEHGPKLPKKGERGLKRAARKARRTAHARRLQRVTWCSFTEREKRLNGWTLESCAYSEATHVDHVRAYGRCVGCQS